MLEHLLGPGTVKAGVKVINHLTGDALHGVEKVMEEITASPAYTKYRFDHAKDTLSDFWDDHKDGVQDFFENAEEVIGDGLDTVGEVASGLVETVGETIGGILESLF